MYTVLGITLVLARLQTVYHCLGLFNSKEYIFIYRYMHTVLGITLLLARFQTVYHCSGLFNS